MAHFGAATRAPGISHPAGSPHHVLLRDGSQGPAAQCPPWCGTEVGASVPQAGDALLERRPPPPPRSLYFLIEIPIFLLLFICHTCS